MPQSNLSKSFGQIFLSTMAKKFRELHSLTLFILERKDDYGIASTFQNHFYPYLKKIAEVEKLARVIPMNHMDRILNVTQDDLMVYCILKQKGMIFRGSKILIKIATGTCNYSGNHL